MTMMLVTMMMDDDFDHDGTWCLQALKQALRRAGIDTGAPLELPSMFGSGKVE